MPKIDGKGRRESSLADELETDLETVTDFSTKNSSKQGHQ